MSGPEDWKVLYRYWLSKRIDGLPPGREDIDPIIDIPHLARHLVLMEVLPDRYRYRLMGTAAALVFGIDLTGKDVGTGIAPAGLAASWIQALNFVSQNRTPKLMVTQFSQGITAENVVLLLPLIGAEGNTEQILAGTFSNRDYRVEMRGTIFVDRPIEL
jgi:hypothetical protein